MDNLAEYLCQFFLKYMCMSFPYLSKTFFYQSNILAFGHLNAIMITLYYKTEKKITAVLFKNF